MYFSQANLIPIYNSSNASTGKRLETAIETVICSVTPFIAQISETLTAIALYPKCFKGIYIKLKCTPSNSISVEINIDSSSEIETTAASSPTPLTVDGTLFSNPLVK